MQREILDRTIREHCTIRGGVLHAINVRSHHVHVVVTATRSPEDVMNQLKSWSSRKLNAHAGVKGRWWTYHGRTRGFNDEEYLANAIRDVLEGQ